MDDRGAWRLLLALAALNVLGYVDRQLLAALAPVLIADLGLSRAEVGLLVGLAFVGCTPSARCSGVLADRGPRPRLIAAGLGAWSAATALTGTASGFASLAAWRALVGVGEASLPPDRPLDDRRPSPYRPRRLRDGVYYAGVPVGLRLSFALAGSLVPRFGWRACFLVARRPRPRRGRDGVAHGRPAPARRARRAGRAGARGWRVARRPALGALAAEPTLGLLVVGATLLVYESAASQHLDHLARGGARLRLLAGGVSRLGGRPRGGTRRQSRSGRHHRRGAAPTGGRTALRLRRPRGPCPSPPPPSSTAAPWPRPSSSPPGSSPRRGLSAGTDRWSPPSTTGPCGRAAR